MLNQALLDFIFLHVFQINVARSDKRAIKPTQRVNHSLFFLFFIFEHGHPCSPKIILWLQKKERANHVMATVFDQLSVTDYEDGFCYNSLIPSGTLLLFLRELQPIKTIIATLWCFMKYDLSFLNLYLNSPKRGLLNLIERLKYETRQ